MWTDKAKREGVALALVLATTLGGWHLQQASASTPPTTARAENRVAAPKEPPVDRFAYGDLLDAVQYQLGFEPDARDAASVLAACSSLLDAKGPEGALREAAAPIVAYCQNPNEDEAARAPDAYVAYREAMFDGAK